jgi:anti-sigma regulatory factor (Ser/Thr protein kinase)
MVMAATRSVLRATAARLTSPGEVLRQVNELLCPDMPAKMFVTCLYGVLEPETGVFRYANAGHNLPYVGTETGVVELRARGMPLGLMPGMAYEEKEAVLSAGESVLLHSDGVAEAHNAAREMFGFPRLMKLMESGDGGNELIDVVLTELDRFTGHGWEQEDDITLVALRRTAGATMVASANGTDRVLAEFTVPSDPGNERLVMARVAEAVQGIDLGDRLERLKTAVAEATMNAIEHGNQNRSDLDVAVRVVASDTELRVRITDQGGERPIPEAELPDLEAKLEGLQKPRGWGLFLIKNMVDELDVSSDETHHTVELVLHLKGDDDAS